MGMIAEDWLSLKHAHERNIMIKWTQAARIIIICAYCVVGIGCCFAILPSLGNAMTHLMNTTRPSRSLPIQIYYMYDISKRLRYELTFVSQIVNMLIVSVAYLGMDNLLGLLVFHVCGQLDILRDRLTYLHKFKDFYEYLKSNVMYHKRLIRAIAAIEDTYNMIFFILFLYFAVLFAFYAFLIISLFEQESDVSIFHMAYLIIAVIFALSNTFLYCLIGELLVTHYDGIYYGACNQAWYTLHSKNAKDMIPLLIRSGKPIYLTAGKIFPLTISTFCSLMKTSTGYVSVLLTAKT